MVDQQNQVMVYQWSKVLTAFTCIFSFTQCKCLLSACQFRQDIAECVKIMYNVGSRLVVYVGSVSYSTIRALDVANAEFIGRWFYYQPIIFLAIVLASPLISLIHQGRSIPREHNFCLSLLGSFFSHPLWFDAAT